MSVSPESSPELNPLSLGYVRPPNGGDGSDDVDVLAPLPEYKAAGETVLDFDGLLRPAPDLRLREDLTEGCGGQTWPAGMVLARHMLRHRRTELTNARILELGAGSGLVGLAVALARQTEDACSGRPGRGPSSPVYITDQEPMRALMEHNIALNGLQSEAKALVLNWGEPLPADIHRLRPNVVLAADCVYFEPAFPLLLATLAALLSPDMETPGEPTVVYFCFMKRRRADMQFLKQARKRFCVAEVADADRPVFSRQGLFLYTLTRKAKPAVPTGRARATEQGTRQSIGPPPQQQHPQQQQQQQQESI
ncbi:hypothetical protein SPI_00346 [Niveomyces insectorum RCEF 264]|uniref:Protein-lysine N-methyltransferase EFM6 n=1 Tax=Niveomyces insectorum RCEF 264 TaxID=1081102 RepID=A0A168A280_9HYPO|nr:hypothetical protein SPI_00346 [Niveomyces insectorum RCEF 264]